MLSLLDDEFAHFRDAVALGKASDINADRQVKVNGCLVTVYSLHVEASSIQGIDGELGRSLAVVYNHDAIVTASRIGIDAQATVAYTIRIGLCRAFV